MNGLFHPQTKQQLEQQVNHPAHAIAIIGDDGAGKGYIAEQLAAELLQTVELNKHPYVLQIDASDKTSGIEQIRAIQQFISLTVPGKHAVKRVVIIEHLDALGHEAQNALLKTLEEPPQDTVLIVTISHRESVLPTIYSRLQRVTAHPVAQELALDYFKTEDPTTVSRAYFISGGYVGLLCALLDNQSEHPLVTAIDRARRLLQQSRGERLASVDGLLKDKTLTPILLLDGLYRLLDASYRQSLATKERSQLEAMMVRLKLVEAALTDLAANVHAKLVLSRLFLEL